AAGAAGWGAPLPRGTAITAARSRPLSGPDGARSGQGVQSPSPTDAPPSGSGRVTGEAVRLLSVNVRRRRTNGAYRWGGPGLDSVGFFGWASATFPTGPRLSSQRPRVQVPSTPPYLTSNQRGR